MPKRWVAETKEKATRLVMEHRSGYSSESAAITTIATRLGMSAETLRKWVPQTRVDAGQEKGLTTEQAAEIRALKPKNAAAHVVLDPGISHTIIVVALGQRCSRHGHLARKFLSRPVGKVATSGCLAIS